MSPDLIGEVRMIVAPVDAELGRGNAQIQFLTRSGRISFAEPVCGPCETVPWMPHLEQQQASRSQDRAWSPTKPDWSNTISSRKLGWADSQEQTFFFALWDSLLVNNRTTPTHRVTRARGTAFSGTSTIGTTGTRSSNGSRDRYSDHCGSGWAWEYGQRPHDPE